MTWKPEPKMTERQTEKALNVAAVDFERKILEGFAADNRQTFRAYAEYVLGIKERAGAKHRTLEYYREMLVRINEAIGHLKLADIRPAHLNAFYANLGERGIRKDGHRAIAKTDIAALVKEKGFTKKDFAKTAQISEATVTSAMQGKRVSLPAAYAISSTLGEEAEIFFTFEMNDEPLSTKTVLEHHRLISTVLRQAEKEMIIQYNAASRATPPKATPTEAETFQPEEVYAIRDALEREPLKWKAFTHLLLVSGCRRGEIAGLLWERVDWNNSQIKIAQSLLYSKTKGVYVDTPKTNTTRFIKLPDETMSLLHEYRMWYLELQMANGDRWENSGFVFVQDNGAHIHPDSINAWLRGFAKRHGLPKINPHKFRHTMASLLYFNGVDTVAISKRLGHAKVSTTQNFYAHFIKQADEIASECIADSILRSSPPETPRKPALLRTKKSM